VENFEKAVEAYKAQIAKNPEDAASYYGLGRSENKLNLDPEAKKALQEAVKKDPDNAVYIIAYAAILMKLAQYPEAVTQLKAALQKDPNNVEAQQRLEDAQAGKSRVQYSPTPKPSPTPKKTPTPAVQVSVAPPTMKQLTTPAKPAVNN